MKLCDIQVSSVRRDGLVVLENIMRPTRFSCEVVRCKGSESLMVGGWLLLSVLTSLLCGHACPI